MTEDGASPEEAVAVGPTVDVEGCGSTEGPGPEGMLPAARVEAGVGPADLSHVSAWLRLGDEG